MPIHKNENILDSNRQLKVGKLFQEELAEAFRKWASEEFPGNIISVTEVKVTPDLSVAKIYVSIFPNTRKESRKALSESKRFEAPAYIEELAEMAKPIASLGNMTGEGWFLTGEMVELIKSGAPNIVCAQPFACLPNHIVGKGVIKELRRLYPESNIVAVDYDPGASEVNQLNRIKLMMSSALRKMNEEK